MIIVHSCSSNSYSGLEQYVVELADYQNRNQKKLKPILFCREGSLIHQNATEKGIPVWTIGKRDRPGPNLWLKMRSKWREILKQDSNAVLHMHAGGEPWFHLPWRVKKILQYHIWITHKKKDPIHWFLFSKISEVWTSSISSKKNLAEILPVDEKKIRIVPYGRDMIKLKNLKSSVNAASIREKFGIKATDELAVCVTRFEMIKGVEELLSSFVEVAPHFKNAHLLIVGDASKDNPGAQIYTDRLRQKWKSLPSEIQNRIHMPGYLSGVDEILASSDFYVLPSYEECFSLAMLDSAILGKPILGTDSGGTPSIVIPGETGFLAKPRSIQDLETGFNKLFGNESLRKKMGMAIAKLVENYDQEKIFHEIEKNYENRK